MKEFNLLPEMVGYIGNDVIDIKVLKSAGVSIAPSDALARILSLIQVITKSKVVQGVLRDVIEILIDSDCKLKSNFHLLFKIQKTS